MLISLLRSAAGQRVGSCRERTVEVEVVDALLAALDFFNNFAVLRILQRRKVAGALADLLELLVVQILAPEQARRNITRQVGKNTAITLLVLRVFHEK